MKKSIRLLLSVLVVAGLLLVPAISFAVPGNGNGNDHPGDNGNHYGWNKDKGSDDNGPVSVPEPMTLVLLGVGIAGVGSYFIVKERRK